MPAVLASHTITFVKGVMVMTDGGPIPSTGPRLSPRGDRAVRWAAVVLTLAGAFMLLAGVSAGIALPLVAIGASLVAIEQVDRRRGRGQDR